MKTQIVWVRPKLRFAFNLMLSIAIVIAVWCFILALIFGSGFWWGAVTSAIGSAFIYALADYAGAYDERIERVEDDGEQDADEDHSA